ncbi:hypothetical protein HMPREF9440_02380 [Sutterella parvirubra YIT 11816]|uniref:Uncharacterized protein n=1 Tax=Sutterella parvirubra YIT 11816 TaxID=762967 RepID=H3KHY3_9BURK|nr:hypothetical protein HMPREF9440_02380 [Sutterella parvirubra YIT 11816]
MFEFGRRSATDRGPSCYVHDASVIPPIGDASARTLQSAGPSWVGV